MTPRYHLNLARRPFGRYRSTNLGLAVILIAILCFGAWQGMGFVRYSEDLVQLREQEQEARVESQFLGTRIEELDAQLGRPGTVEGLREIAFLNEILERKRFSWTRLLREIEAVMPRTVYIVSLAPFIDDTGTVRLRMEARGQSVDALTRFLSNLGDSPSFSDITVSIEESGEVDGRAERRLLTEASYAPRQNGEELAQ